MKEKENECNGEKQLNLELCMGCCKCVLRLQQLPVEWNSMLLVLLEMESRILSFPYLGQCHVTIVMFDTKFWQAYLLRSG